MKALFKIIACLLCLSIILLTAGCGGSYKDAYIYYELDTIPKTLDPQLVKTDDEATVVRCLYDTLLRYDQAGNIIPSAAESFSQNGLVYTFKLKRNAKWTNGTPVTAQDFQFGFYRAVNPETASPYASSLSNIKNADKILSGNAEISSLGVNVVDDYILEIILDAEDPEFLNTLTTPISMPCNKDFFDSCKGTYGLSLDSTLCNGSYYVRVWDSEEFLIRLAKNLEFNGAFEANSMRMYFTCTNDKSTTNIIKGNSDLGFVDSEEIGAISNEGLNSLAVQSECYMLTFGEAVKEDFRKALITSVSTDSFKDSLSNGYRLADNIYPTSLNINNPGLISDTIAYDINSAAELYNNLVKTETIGNLALRYVDNPICENVAKALAAHWQQHLGIFINIEKVSLSYANSLYNSGEAIVIMPFNSFGGSYISYVSTLGSKSRNPKAAQTEILSSYRFLPLFFSDKYIAFNDYIKLNKEFISYGVPDLALITKNE